MQAGTGPRPSPTRKRILDNFLTNDSRSLHTMNEYYHAGEDPAEAGGSAPGRNPGSVLLAGRAGGPHVPPGIGVGRKAGGRGTAERARTSAARAAQSSGEDQAAGARGVKAAGRGCIQRLTR